MRLLLFATLLPLALSAAAAPLPCATAPAKALPALLRRAMKSGDKQVLQGAQALLANGSAPALLLTFGDGDDLHYFYVTVAPGKGPDELKPTAILLGSLADAGGRRVRWLFRASLSGQLLEALQILDALDAKGEAMDGQERRLPQGLYDPRTRAQFQRDLKFLCLAQDRGTLSIEETQEKLEKGR